MNRRDLMDQFGLSVNQVCIEMNRYVGFAPDNMVYDKSARTYVRGSDYAAQFLKPDASCYLAQLRSLADGVLDRENSWTTNLPPYGSAPTLVRGVKAKSKVQRALLYHALKRLALAADLGARKPQDQQSVLLNPDLTGAHNE